MVSKKEKLTIRLTPHQMQCLRELSDNLDVSYSLLVRAIIQDFLFRNEDTLDNIIIKKSLKNKEEILDE